MEDRVKVDYHALRYGVVMRVRTNAKCQLPLMSCVRDLAAGPSSHLLVSQRRVREPVEYGAAAEVGRVYPRWQDRSPWVQERTGAGARAGLLLLRFCSILSESSRALSCRQVVSFVALIPCGYRDFCIQQRYTKRKNAEGREGT
jgi:hypothetical protein